MDGFVIGGTSSGVGKTVATLAVTTALEDAGRTVQPAKAGPDFIDPSHHEAVADRPSRTLDLWLQGTDGLRRNYWRGDGDVCVVEGVMGLYDGDCSSTAAVADALSLPVVLVVDAAAGMESVAATALGFREYAARAGRDITVAGVIAQRAHGGRHAEGVRDALPDEISYLGRIPPSDDLEIPDRHLGLEMGTEAPLSESALENVAENVRTERLVDLAETPPEPAAEPVQSVRTDRASDHRVAVASDSAFCFSYTATTERLNRRAEVETFSPVAGDPVPPADGVYLPGGYPELYGEELAESSTLSNLATLAEEGVPIYGECGGLMALSNSLTTADGDRYDMAGILPADVTMHDRYQALDHVELEATRRSPTAKPGDRRRGHEFHYSEATVDDDARFCFTVERGDGIDGTHDGLIEYATVGTYCHCHPESGVFDSFVDDL